MKQSRTASLIESVINILVGFGIAVAAQAIFLPLLGVPIPLAANLGFAAIMTAISIARSYALRRLFEALHIRRPLSPFAQAVIAERFRQIEAEGWSTAHDDEHEPGEMAEAGAAYAQCAGVAAEDNRTPPPSWPWSPEWWKPRDFRRDLVRAGALIIAEGERHDRTRRRDRAIENLQRAEKIRHSADARRERLRGAIGGAS